MFYQENGLSLPIDQNKEVMAINIYPSRDITDEIQLKLAIKRYLEVRWTVSWYLVGLKTLPIFVTLYSFPFKWPKYNEDLQGYYTCLQKKWPLAINLIPLFDLVAHKTLTSTHSARCWSPRTENVAIENLLNIEQNTS